MQSVCHGYAMQMLKVVASLDYIQLEQILLNRNTSTHNNPKKEVISLNIKLQTSDWQPESSIEMYQCHAFGHRSFAAKLEVLDATFKSCHRILMY